MSTKHRVAHRRRVTGWLRAVPAALMGLALAAPAQAAGQLVLIPDPKLLGIMLVGFVALIFPVNALIFKPIFEALDARAERIAGAQSRAAHIQSEADAILNRYEARIREARAEAESTRKEQLLAARDEHAELTQAARQEAEHKIDQARNELAAELTRGRESLRDQSRDLARLAAESILGRSLS